MTRVAGDPAELRLTARQLLDQQTALVHTARDAVGHAAGLPPCGESPHVAATVASFSAASLDKSYRLWTHRQELHRRADMLEIADGSASFRTLADFAWRLGSVQGANVLRKQLNPMKLPGNLSKAIRKGMRFYIDHKIPIGTPNRMARLAKLKPWLKASKILGGAGRILGGITTAINAAKDFNREAGEQFEADVRRNDLSDGQKRARAALVGGVAAGVDYGVSTGAQMAGAAGGAALGALAGGAIGGPVGAVVGAGVGRIVGGAIGGWAGAKLGKPLGHLTGKLALKGATHIHIGHWKPFG